LSELLGLQAALIKLGERAGSLRWLVHTPKVGDLVRNKNSESGEFGLFMGMRAFKYHDSLTNTNDVEEDKYYSCGEVYWPRRTKNHAVGTIQIELVEVISESQ
jgi:hypothetical protein